MSAAAPDLDRTTLGLAAGVALALLRSRRTGGTPAAAPEPDRRGAAADAPDLTYPQQVAALKDMVRSNLPPGSEALVISRGDPALIDLEPCVARHFPAGERGDWAGFHPALGSAARTLQEQRRSGTHLVVPAASHWWFDTYPELAEYLGSGHLVTERAGIGSIWALPVASTEGAPDRPAPTDRLRAYRAAAAHGAALIAVLVGEDETVSVISRGDPDLLELGGPVGRHFPAGPNGVYGGHPADDADAEELLRSAVEGGSRWLFIPDDASWWQTVYPGFWTTLHEDHVLVADRRHVGRLFRLTAVGEDPERGAR